MARSAAGITAVADTTGRILLCRRSRLVTMPGLWACPAGRVDPGERPLDAAVREFREETEYTGPILLGPPVRQRFRGRTFHHFSGLVPTQFLPRLNWENDEWGWFALDNLPHPLHPGMLQALRPC